VESELSQEHLIPESIGGLLTSDFLCRSCNSTFGHEIESAAKSDPSIRLAVRNLSAEIPALAEKIEEKQPFIGASKAGQVPGYIRKGQFRVRSKRLKDGSLVQPTEDARKTIETILQKDGYSTMLIRLAISTLDDAPENERIELVPRLEVVKWRLEKIEVDLSNSALMNPLIPAKIAYEFLACHLGGAIYDNAPQMAEIRDSLRLMEQESNAFRIDRLTSNKYEPFHGICFEGNNPHSSVLIRLFSWLAFRVHFPRLAVGGPRFVYTHRLDTGNEYIHQIND